MLFVVSALIALASAKPVAMQMKTEWNAVPFYAHVLETIAVHNSSAYFPLLSVYLAAEEAEGKFASDLEATTFLLDTAESRQFLSGSQLPLVKSQLANAHRAAHIEAMCNHFMHDVVPEFGTEFADCDNVFVYNGKATCEATDVFALESTTKARTPLDLLDTDHVIGGAASEVPWAVLYADFASQDFPVFHSNLLASALEQKVSYVLRYKPSKTASNPSSQIGGYGATAQLKRTDYLVVNDRGVDGEDAPELKLDLGGNKVDESVVPSLDLRAASFILGAEDPFSALIDVSLNFPARIRDFKDHELNMDLLGDIDDNDAADFYSGGTNVLLANGRPVFTTERNIYQLLDTLASEQRFVAGLEELGLGTEKAKELLTSGIVLGDAESAAKPPKPLRYNLASDAIMWLNDIKTDPRFRNWKSAARLLTTDTPPGQFVPIKRNINSLILAVDFSNPSWLQMLGQLLQILRRGAPVQVGIVPVTNGNAAKMFVDLCTVSASLMARQIYIAGLLQGMAPKEAFQQALDAQLPEHPEPVELSSSEIWTAIAKWASQFEINQGAIFANGVHIPVTQTWLVDATAQFGADSAVTRNWVESEELDEADTTTNLRDKLLALGSERRSDIVDPINPAAIVYVDPSAAAAAAPGTAAVWTVPDAEQNVWFVADFNVPQAYTQLATLLDVAGTTKRFSVTVMPLAFGSVDDRYARAYAALQQLSKLPALAAINSIEALGRWHHEDSPMPKIVDEEASPALVAFASQSVRSTLFNTVVPRQANLVIDGRLVVLSQLLDSELITQLIDRETPRVERLTRAANANKIECVSAFVTRITAAWHGTENSRLLTEKWRGQERAVTRNVTNSQVDLVALVDPGSEIGQELVAMIQHVAEMESFSIRVMLSPRQLEEKDILNRHYRGVFPSAPRFDAKGRLAPPSAHFELEDDVLYVLGIDEPAAWVVMAQNCDYDLDNVILNAVTGDRLLVSYELRRLLLEGHASDITAHQAPRGVQLVLGDSQTPRLTDTMIMANLGYFQLQTAPGFFHIELADGPSREIFQFNGDGVTSDGISLWVTEMDGTTIMPQLVRRAGQEAADVLEPPKKSGWFNRKSKSVDSADINIFTVASGHLYERFLSIMTLSVMRHTKHTVKFWLIENFLSPSFKKFLPDLAAEYGFEYEFVTYKWPTWLRGQSEKQREIWGYKILFLDVLFPQSLSKVIFVDSDQIVRTDMMELVNEDLKGAPYGYTPMGDDREEMEGFRFWKQGYWERFLQGAPYHISALYVVDLDRFRQMGAGDILRQHYQQLSADPNSLSNLDQDLPNNLQFIVPIHSLNKDWLWCETWCSDEGLKTAKTIDLCNNPLTKEPKLDRARRQIPEWVEYDDAVAALRKKAAEAARKRAEEAEAEAAKAADAALDIDDDEEVHDEL